jgi:hypothetical protein
VKKIRFFIVLLMLLNLVAYTQITFNGFDKQNCGNTPNHTYTVTSGSSGQGGFMNLFFTVYRDGDVIYNSYSNLQNPVICKALVFINDSTGYLVVHRPSGISTSGLSVLKTSNYGLTWTTLNHYSLQHYLGMYVVNENYIYLVAYFNSQIRVARCTSAPISSTYSSFINDNNSTQDIYKTDSVPGNSLCSINNLNISVQNGTASVVYHINIGYKNPIVSVNEYLKNNENIEYLPFPNPSTNYVSLKGDLQGVSSIDIINSYGQKVKTFSQAEIDKNKLDIANLPNGIYIISILKTNKRMSIKMQINNPN